MKFCWTYSAGLKFAISFPIVNENVINIVVMVALYIYYRNLISDLTELAIRMTGKKCDLSFLDFLQKCCIKIIPRYHVPSNDN